MTFPATARPSASPLSLALRKWMPAHTREAPNSSARELKNLASRGSRDRTTGRVFGPEEELGERIRVARVALDFGELGGALGRVESRRWAGPQLTPGFQDPGLPAAHAGQEWVARPEPRPRRNCAGP